MNPVNPTKAQQNVLARKAFGAWLRTHRRARNLTGEELAQRLGVHYVTINNWERGKQNPGSRRIVPLARTLGVHPRELVDVLKIDLPGFAEGEEYVEHRGNWAPAADPIGTTVSSRLQYRFMVAAVNLESADRWAFLECAAEILRRSKTP